MNININVTGQKLKIETNLKQYVSGSSNFIKFVFNLGNDWSGTLPFAQFTQDGKTYNKYLLTIDGTANSVYMPSEIVPGECRLMLYGAGNNKKITTNYLTLIINDSLYIDNADSTDISQSLYQQLIGRFNLAVYGKAFIADHIIDMIDTTQIYVYTGDESDGGVFGDWYHFNGTSWVSGGAYVSQVFSLGDNMQMVDHVLSAKTDKTLSVTDMPADAGSVRNEFDTVYDIFSENNSFDVILSQKKINSTLYGVTYSWGADGRCVVSGTSSSDYYSTNRIFSNESAMPPGLRDGKKCRVFFSRYENGEKITDQSRKNELRLHIVFFGSGGTQSGNYYVSNDTEITVPSETIGAKIELFCDKNISFDQQIVASKIMTMYTNEELSDKIDDLNEEVGSVDELATNLESRVDKSLEVVSILADNTDLSSVSGVGIHGISGNYNYTNLPSVVSSATKAGYLLSIEISASSQMLMYINKVYGIFTAFKTYGAWEIEDNSLVWHRCAYQTSTRQSPEEDQTGDIK